MKFSLISLVFAASSVFAELGQVLLCTGVNQTGTCELVRAQVLPTGSEGECFSLEDTAFSGKNGTLGTFAPDGEHFGCYARYIPCGGICRAASGCSVTQKPITFDYANKYNVPAGIKSFGCFSLHPSASNGSEPTKAAGEAVPSITCACASASSSNCACDNAQEEGNKLEKRRKKGKKVKKPKTKTTAIATATARMDLWTDERDGD